MSELVILNIPSDLSDRMHRLAQAGDEAAERWFQELWAEYAGPFECFLCGAEIEKQGRLATLAVPDRPGKKGHKQQMMISLICAACVGLPPMVRWNRAIRMVKRMHGRQFNSGSLDGDDWPCSLSDAGRGWPGFFWRSGLSIRKSFSRIDALWRRKYTRCEVLQPLSTGRGASLAVSDTRDQAVHEPLSLRKIAIAKAKQMMTADHDPATGSPLQQLHRIVAEAGRCLATA